MSEVAEMMTAQGAREVNWGLFLTREDLAVFMDPARLPPGATHLFNECARFWQLKVDLVSHERSVRAAGCMYGPPVGWDQKGGAEACAASQNEIMGMLYVAFQQSTPPQERVTPDTVKFPTTAELIKEGLDLGVYQIPGEVDLLTAACIVGYDPDAADLIRSFQMAAVPAPWVWHANLVLSTKISKDEVEDLARELPRAGVTLGPPQGRDVDVMPGTNLRTLGYTIPLSLIGPSSAFPTIALFHKGILGMYVSERREKSKPLALPANLAHLMSPC